jgi:hypothetical protein
MRGWKRRRRWEGRAMITRNVGERKRGDRENEEEKDREERKEAASETGRKEGAQERKRGRQTSRQARRQAERKEGRQERKGDLESSSPSSRPAPKYTFVQPMTYLFEDEKGEEGGERERERDGWPIIENRRQTIVMGSAKQADKQRNRRTDGRSDETADRERKIGKLADCRVDRAVRRTYFSSLSPSGMRSVKRLRQCSEYSIPTSHPPDQDIQIEETLKSCHVVGCYLPFLTFLSLPFLFFSILFFLLFLFMVPFPWWHLSHLPSPGEGSWADSGGARAR